MSQPLFLCHGNVMRSQMAEGFYNYFTNSTDARSAGVNPETPKKFTSPHHQGIAVMAEEGIDVSKQTCKLVTPEMVESADVVYCMTYKEALPDFVLKSPKVIYWDIEDPYDMPLHEVREIRDQVKEHVQGIVSTKKASSRSSLNLFGPLRKIFA
jgi:arsenate reductase (thioredoxin)